MSKILYVVKTKAEAEELVLAGAQRECVALWKDYERWTQTVDGKQHISRFHKVQLSARLRDELASPEESPAVANNKNKWSE